MDHNRQPRHRLAPSVQESMPRLGPTLGQDRRLEMAYRLEMDLASALGPLEHQHSSLPMGPLVGSVTRPVTGFVSRIIRQVTYWLHITTTAAGSI